MCIRDRSYNCNRFKPVPLCPIAPSYLLEPPQDNPDPPLWTSRMCQDLKSSVTALSTLQDVCSQRLWWLHIKIERIVTLSATVKSLVINVVLCVHETSLYLCVHNRRHHRHSTVSYLRWHLSESLDCERDVDSLNHCMRHSDYKLLSERVISSNTDIDLHCMQCERETWCKCWRCQHHHVCMGWKLCIFFCQLHCVDAS